VADGPSISGDNITALFLNQHGHICAEASDVADLSTGDLAYQNPKVNKQGLCKSHSNSKA
jgi:hypothetical protein